MEKNNVFSFAGMDQQTFEIYLNIFQAIGEIVILSLLLYFIIFLYIRINNDHKIQGKFLADFKEDISNEIQDFHVSQASQANKKNFLKDGKDALEILDNIILDKYQYYLYTQIFPKYMGSTKKVAIGKEEFHNLKENFWVEVMGGITPELLEKVKYIFNEKGLIIYINEKFITLFNKTDAKFMDNVNFTDKEEKFFVN